jgi:hypothetical protein
MFLRNRLKTLKSHFKTLKNTDDNVDLVLKHPVVQMMQDQDFYNCRGNVKYRHRACQKCNTELLTVFNVQSVFGIGFVL